MQPTKLFISHASEDKVTFVRPLVEALEAAGFDVWLDEVALKVGDSIWKGISDGLRECDFGVIVLSKNFMEESKTWPGIRMDGHEAEQGLTGGVVALEFLRADGGDGRREGAFVHEAAVFAPCVLEQHFGFQRIEGGRDVPLPLWIGGVRSRTVSRRDASKTLFRGVQRLKRVSDILGGGFPTR